MSEEFHRTGTPLDGRQHQVHLNVNTATFDALTYLSQMTGESKRSIIRRALVQHLNEVGFPALVTPTPTHTTQKKETTK
ncbi:hypothetical protein [Citricoccus parietis]|uniref:hypothetical protein n=1 Tax=Citricoccus parietis TaxID=592307 RepID=UPI00366E1519